MVPPLHEQIISETRAVQEAAIRLGRDATSVDIQKFLEEEGLCVSLDFIDHVLKKGSDLFPEAAHNLRESEKSLEASHLSHETKETPP